MSTDSDTEIGEYGLTAEQAVRLAMSEALLAYLALKKDKGRYPEWPSSKPGVLGDFLSEVKLSWYTQLRCEQSSVLTLYYLCKEHASLFKAMMLLKTWEADDDPACKLITRPWERRYSDHTVFLAVAKDSMCYAGPPSNYYLGAAGQGLNPISHIYTGDCQAVVDQLTRFHGGIWPSVDLISRVIASRRSLPVATNDGFVVNTISGIGEKATIARLNIIKTSEMKHIWDGIQARDN